MIRTTLISFLLFPLLTWADLQPSKFYSHALIKEINSLQDNELKETLHRKLANSITKKLSYKTARKLLFGKIHLVKSGKSYKVKDVYCHHNVTAKQGAGPMKIPNSSVMNCEHTWPKSKFNKNQNYKAQLVDLHHLYPSNSRANSVRSNHPFAEVKGNTQAHSNCYPSKKGDAVQSNVYSFEPPENHKGNVARAMFYFSVRFQAPINARQEKFFRKWHLEDPVDSFERKRNKLIEQAQGNRNPFIDDPSLVSSINDF